jgi:hypothetical protein
MSRRIEIELTSDRGDGSWTWRAAGARQPKGEVPADLLPGGAKVGDVLRAEVETELEGITVLSLASTQTRDRSEPERIEVLGSRRDDDQLVTTRLVSKGRSDRGDRGDRDRRPRRPRDDRGERGDRPERGDRREGAGRASRGDGPRDGDRRRSRGRSEGQGGDRRPRHPAPPPLPERPKPKRLRPGRTHRKAVLAELPPEQQPIAEEVLRGGIPGVRQAIDAENEKRKAAGEAPIDGKELLRLAEQLLPRMRTADWRDRAEAALATADELDLRDLRSVVVAADTAARDDETREMAAQLRTKLDERVVQEQAQWVEDLQLALDAGRIVRALRVSSRPPKAGTMLAPELRLALLGGANAALTAEATPDRWAAVLDAIAYAPVRTEVAPVSTPDAPSEELLAVIKKYASRVPKVAVAFGIEATARPSGRSLRPKPPARRPGTVPVPARPESPAALAAPAPADAAPEAPPVEAEAPPVEADAPPVEAEAPPAEPDVAPVEEDHPAG